MKCYKGFDKNMQCREFQFEEGKTYEEPTAALCYTGFHACERPIDCFGYYEPNDSIYHEVWLEGVTDECRGEDTKRAGTKITIGRELSAADVVIETVKHAEKYYDKSVYESDQAYIVQDLEYAKCEENCAVWGFDKSVVVGKDDSAFNVGNNSVAVSGRKSAVRCGEMSGVISVKESAIVGDSMSALTTGEMSAIKGYTDMSIKTGGCSAISSERCSKIKAGRNSAVCTGSNSTVDVGKYSVAIGGYSSQIAGETFSVIAITQKGRYKGGKWSVFVGYKYNNHGEHIGVVTAVVDGVNIKEDTWYAFDGEKFVEAGDCE